jgi:hypothetical protein
MPQVHLFQIYYSEQTRGLLDRGFQPLDNLRNERPDWREYWPIRNFLTRRALVPGDYYGFFSPRFGLKTNLDSTAVLDFIRAGAGGADVFLFSPFFDQGAMFLNIVEQGAAQHGDMAATLRECVALIAPEFDPDAAANSSLDTVFCNYFVACAEFWAVWFERCEQIYRIAEEGVTELARRLNSAIAYDVGAAPTKVFVLERVASVLLASQRHWRVKPYDPMATAFSPAPVSRHHLELVILDALKIAYATQRYEPYLRAFRHVQRGMLRTLARTGGS